MGRHVVKHYCPKCEQNKPVFDIDKFDKKRCPECGTELVQKKFSV